MRNYATVNVHKNVRLDLKKISNFFPVNMLYSVNFISVPNHKNLGQSRQDEPQWNSTLCRWIRNEPKVIDRYE